MPTKKKSNSLVGGLNKKTQQLVGLIVLASVALVGYLAWNSSHAGCVITAPGGGGGLGTLMKSIVPEAHAQILCGGPGGGGSNPFTGVSVPTPDDRGTLISSGPVTPQADNTTCPADGTSFCHHGNGTGQPGPGIGSVVWRTNDANGHFQLYGPYGTLGGSPFHPTRYNVCFEAITDDPNSNPEFYLDEVHGSKHEVGDSITSWKVGVDHTGNTPREGKNNNGWWERCLTNIYVQGSSDVNVEFRARLISGRAYLGGVYVYLMP